MKLLRKVAVKNSLSGLGGFLSLFLFMQVHRDLSRLPVFRNAVITIGTFDGVHAGHRKIIEQLQEEAGKIGGETVIITFHPHPRKVVREGQAPVPILTTLPEKVELLNELGINHLVVIPFNEAFASQTADEYIENFLFRKFHPHTIIIGYDHKFGKGRSGNYQLLEVYGKKLGFAVKEIPEHVLNEITISSTKIREALLTHDVATANHFLSYSYFFEGIVVKGKQLGRTLGYPTANIEVPDNEKLIPGNGIYTVEATLQPTDAGTRPSAISNQLAEEINEVISATSQAIPQALQGMMSIGLNPTVNGAQRTIEVNLFNWDQDIYGQTLRIFLKRYLRAEEKFSSLDALIAQLDIDKENSLKVFGITHNS